MRENAGMPHTIADWKEDIRDMLLRVRDQLNHFIDMFTHKFIKQIGRMEQEKQELMAFVGEDRRQGERLTYIETRLEKVISMLAEIELLPPNHKASATSKFEPEMLKLEQEVVVKDQEMKQVNDVVQRGLGAAVDLNGLSHRLFQKYNNFI